MANPKLFALNQKLSKSLDGYNPKLGYGERLEMFNNVYKVLSSQENGYTFVEDEKHDKVAYPTNKLKMLMKSGICKNLGSIAKAQISGPGSKVGVTPKAVNAAYAKQGAAPKAASTGQPRGEPVGTVTTGADGQRYKKTQMSPSVWVKVSEGTAHSDPGGKEHDHGSSPQVQADFDKTMQQVESKIHPSDRPAIKEKVNEWLKERSKFHHLRQAHNTHDVDDSGKKLPKAANESGASQVLKQGDKSRELFHAILEAVKASHKKLKGEANA